MRRLLLAGSALLAAALRLLLPVSGLAAEERGAVYLGNQGCSECHAETYRLWVGSPHSRTWVQLHSRGAMPIGIAEGWKEGDSMPTESGLCLGCHAVGAALSPGAAAGNFHIEEGVQCETCHGPAGRRLKSGAGKDSLIVNHDGLIKPTEKTCLNCHILRPSHSRVEAHAWDFAARWKRIQHGKEK